MTRPGPGAGSPADMLDERRHLLETALWMFGSPAAAERIVQETYRRWYALGDGERAVIAQPRAWLTRVAGGICLELLAATAATRPGGGPPDPGGPAVPGGPPRRPRPRRGPDPVTVWARRHSHRGGTDRAVLDRHDRVARRFAAACEAGDTAALKAVLAADAIVVSDGGGKVRADARPTHGADAVARFVADLPAGRPRTDLTAESVNGRTGLVLRRAGRAVAVVSLSTAGDEVTAVWIVLNPDKLRRWHRP
ncbi:hypothetical protein [Actinomadura sp. 21ATH]|uniref:hypothetical protein n=1 Tax=Actinomadura sp. 21ATH TaxID=1735444 RepID=UPI0035BFDACC